MKIKGKMYSSTLVQLLSLSLSYVKETFKQLAQEVLHVSIFKMKNNQMKRRVMSSC